jgi:hypothetical protein
LGSVNVIQPPATTGDRRAADDHRRRRSRQTDNHTADDGRAPHDNVAPATTIRADGDDRWPGARRRSRVDDDHRRIVRHDAAAA